ncbi:MAG: hypothetical protein JO058_14675 [Alphaproteobacteria bacterium]|nr:hypothetical protein [Alphaproteobacteria bacterium]
MFEWLIRRRPINQLNLHHQLAEIPQLTLVASSALWSEAERQAINLCQRAMLLEYDLFIVLDDFQSTSDPDRQKHYVRQLVLIITDLFKNLLPVLKNVIKELKRSAPTSLVTQDMCRAQKRFKEIRKSHQLRHLRNNAGAHHDKDANAQLNALKSIKVSYKTLIIKQLLEAFTELSMARRRLIESWREKSLRNETQQELKSG